MNNTSFNAVRTTITRTHVTPVWKTSRKSITSFLHDIDEDFTASPVSFSDKKTNDAYTRAIRVIIENVDENHNCFSEDGDEDICNLFKGRFKSFKEFFC